METLIFRYVARYEESAKYFLRAPSNERTSCVEGIYRASSNEAQTFVSRRDRNARYSRQTTRTCD